MTDSKKTMTDTIDLAHSSDEVEQQARPIPKMTEESVVGETKLRKGESSRGNDDDMVKKTLLGERSRFELDESEMHVGAHHVPEKGGGETGYYAESNWNEEMQSSGASFSDENNAVQPPPPAELLRRDGGRPGARPGAVRIGGREGFADDDSMHDSNENYQSQSHNRQIPNGADGLDNNHDELILAELAPDAEDLARQIQEGIQ